MAAGGKEGCWILTTTSSLAAKGTVAGLLLAGLIWAGVSLAGLAILAALLLVLLGLFCRCTCPDCGGPDCSDCGSCGECCGSCDLCSTSDGGEGGGGGASGGGESESCCSCIALPTALSVGTARPRRPIDLAHHPDLPQYQADVYRVRNARLCIGCFTTYPVFFAAAAALFLATPAMPWAPTLSMGIALAAVQATSSLGLARTRAAKAIVKTCLGAGLALAVYSTLISPLSGAAQFAVLAGALLLAQASAIPRARRMRRETACTCVDRAATGGARPGRI